MLYDYECSNCSATLEDVQQSIKDKPLTKCEECGHKTLERLITGGIMIAVKEVKTIGQLIDKNNRVNRGMFNEKAAKEKEENPEPEKPWWKKRNNTSDAKINSMTPERKHKWIMEGD
jgi:putative FmdB family regulatory protein